MRTRIFAALLAVLTVAVFNSRCLAQGRAAGGQVGGAQSGRSSGIGAGGGSRPPAQSMRPGNRSFSSASQLNTSSNVGTLNGNEQFGRGSQASGGFIGNDATDVANFLGSIAGTGGQRSQQQNLRNTRRGQNANLNDNDGPEQAGRTTIPFRVVLGFAPPAPRPAITAATIDRRLRRSLVRLSEQPRAAASSVTPRTPQFTVALDGRTAVLTGTVESDHASKVAAAMARLEPGVSDVRNELVVVPKDGSSE